MDLLSFSSLALALFLSVTFCLWMRAKVIEREKKEEEFIFRKTSFQTLVPVTDTRHAGHVGGGVYISIVAIIFLSESRRSNILNISKRKK
jgi:hypothetical protein